MITISITDDHIKFRTATTKLLTAAGFTIIVVTVTGQNLIHAIQSGKVPHIAIINYKTSNPDNLWVAVWIKEHYPAIKIIMTSLYDLHVPVLQLRQIGIEGLVIKSQVAPQRLVEVVRVARMKSSPS